MGKWNGPPHEPQYLCGAYARSTGKPCRRFARKNGRCKLHGGLSIGARKPRMIHGMYSKEFIALRKRIKTLIEDSDQLVDSI